ncbi:unannotated protein [freshwater metagenome]|uniref:Unannotated protein n=1 Tax=freshwater metagenome TaxID=449393 RepID=A0A6J6D2F0_9ZZZZ
MKGGQRALRLQECDGAQPSGVPEQLCGRNLRAKRLHQDAFLEAQPGFHRLVPRRALPQRKSYEAEPREFRIEHEDAASHEDEQRSRCQPSSWYGRAHLERKGAFLDILQPLELVLVPKLATSESCCGYVLSLTRVPFIESVDSYSGKCSQVGSRRSSATDLLAIRRSHRELSKCSAAIKCSSRQPVYPNSDAPVNKGRSANS